MSGIWAPAFIADSEIGDTVKVLKTYSTEQFPLTIMGTVLHKEVSWDGNSRVCTIMIETIPGVEKHCFTVSVNYHAEILLARWSEYCQHHSDARDRDLRRPMVRRMYRVWASLPAAPAANLDLSDHYVEALISGTAFTAHEREGWFHTV